MLRSAPGRARCDEGGRYQHGALKVEEAVADETGECEVGDVEIRADDRKGDDDDHGRGEELAPPRPLDLLELGGRFSREGAKTAAALPLRAGLALRLADGLDLAPARARAV